MPSRSPHGAEREPGWDATPFDPPDSTPARLDRLEARAVQAITDCYGDNLNEDARFWIQRGIEGMRLAVATEDEGC